MPEEPQERDTEVCPECGSSNLVWDREQGTVVCGNCGYVVREKMKDRGPEWRAFSQEQREDRSRVGPPPTPTRHDKGLPTTIAKTNKDAKGNPISSDRRAEIARLGKWQGRSTYDKEHPWTLKNALSDISRICSQMGFSKHVKERASYLYRKTSKAGIVQGRPTEAAVAAVLYIACVESGRPISFENLAETAGTTKKETQRIHWLIIQEFGIKSLPISPVKYVPVVIRSIETNRAKWKLPQKVGRNARKIAREVEERKLMQGRSMDVVAGVAVFLAAEYGSRNVPAKIVADSLGLAHSTIEKAVDDVAEGIGRDVLSQIVNSFNGGEKS